MWLRRRLLPVSQACWGGLDLGKITPILAFHPVDDVGLPVFRPPHKALADIPFDKVPLVLHLAPRDEDVGGAARMTIGR
jgi:hypothetical protein